MQRLLPALPSSQQQQEQQREQQQSDCVPEAGNDDPSRIWLPEVVHHFAGFLGGNELACTLRLINKATAAQFRGPQHATVRLSLPVPHHAFAWRWGGGDATRSLTVRQRRQLPCLIARSGSVANLEVLLARADLTSPLDATVLEAAAGAGQLEVCRWLRQQGCPWNGGVTELAARAGHKEVCEWLLAEGCPFSIDGMMGYAAGRGHWAVCEWLHANGRSMNVRAAAAAARGGHVGLMDWLLARPSDAQEPDDGWGLLGAAAAGCDLPTLQRLHHTYLGSRGRELPGDDQEKVVGAAAGSPTADWRDKVEWLEGRGYPRTNRACTESARRACGRDRLEWLQQRGYPLITADVAYAAAEQGNMNALEFLLAQGVQLDEGLAFTAAYIAAHGGHLAVLKVLHAHGARIDHRTVSTAARGGQLPVVAWLVKVLGAAKALTARMFAAAATSGSAELEAWLHEAGCPWGQSVFITAADLGSEEQLEWLVARGCPMGDDGDAYRKALENADLAVLRCLRRLGCLWSPLGCMFTLPIHVCGRLFSTYGPWRRKQLLLALTWLVEQGCPIDWAAAEQEAEESGDGEVLAWVRQQLPPSV